MLSVIVAPISTSVTSVVLRIQLVNILFVPNEEMHLPQKTVYLSIMPRSTLPTPILVNRLATLLAGYDPAAVSYLINSFTFGFPVHFEGVRKASFAPNLLSAQLQPKVVTAKLNKELEVGRIAGPFDTPLFPISSFTLRCSP